MQDSEIIKSVLKGNVDKFSIIVEKYEMYVFKIVYNIIKDKSEAEDIVQETFIAAYNKLSTYKDEYKFSTWIFRIAQNKSIDYIRKGKNKKEINMDCADNVISTAISPDEYTEYSIMKDSAAKFIKKLDDIDRQILLFKSIDMLSFSDISQIIDMNESSVKKRYYKVKSNFKKSVISQERECEL